MESEIQEETNEENRFCPKCGFEETGYFCRDCGELLRGEGMVLCPRCHQIVPDGDFCSQCGQSLGGLALSLRQLAMAGDTFWVTGEAAAPVTEPEPTLFEPEPLLFEPDESVELANGELPDWLQELPTETAPIEVQEHIYPSLRPIEGERSPSRRNTAFSTLIILMAMLMLGLMALTVIILLRGGG
jgi:hypothetical protein